MRPVRPKRRAIDILVGTEVSAIMDGFSRTSSTGIRNRAVTAILFGAGLRVGEAIALRVRDVDLVGLAVTVQSGKGDQRRVSPLIPDAAPAIQRWFDRRAQLPVTGHDPLFCTVSNGVGSGGTAPGGPLTREYIARVLRRSTRRAGIEKRVTPHTFRHSFAVLLDRRGLSVNSIRAALGHKRLETTQTYVSHLGSRELSDQIRGIGPVLEPVVDARAELGSLLGRLGDADIAQLVALLKRTST